MLEDIQRQDKVLLGCAGEEVIDQLPARLSHGVLRWADEMPKQLAIISAAGSLTYGELASAVEEAKHWLQEMGVVPGDRVMLIAENGPGLMVLFLALSEMDAVAAVINARLSDREIDLICEDCDPRLVIATVDDSEDARKHL